MRRWHPKRVIWQLGWLAALLAGSVILVRYDIAIRRDAFQATARIAHAVLTQRAVEHDAILATLVLLSPGLPGLPGLRPEQRLPALYPQVLAVLRRQEGDAWPAASSDASLEQAEERSRAARTPALGPVDGARGQYTLVLAGIPSSFALRIDMLRAAASDAWPLDRSGPIVATLEHEGKAILLQPGHPAEVQPVGLTAGFVFEKPLGSASQPFVLRLSRATGPAEWPWGRLFAWTAFSAVATWALAAWMRGRRDRRRTQELLRVGRVARLNTLGELAGGIAHELNQPLSAVLANAQAAQRLLDDDPPDLALARQAMAQAAAQGRRAADVVARLRRLIEAPESAEPRQPVHLAAAVRQVLDLLEPELERRGITVSVDDRAPPVLADPVALEQIVHNLIENAMQVLDAVPVNERRLLLRMHAEDGRGVLLVRDSGPGIAADAMPHLFEPFYTTRSGGLGLGLSLCERLAHAMDGSLSAQNATPRGAEFRLALPLADARARGDA